MQQNCVAFKNFMMTQARRCKAKFSHLYKIINRLTPQYLQALIPQRIQHASKYPLRNMNDLIVPTARTVSYINSFLPSTIREWNSLGESVRNFPSLNNFKFQINRNSESQTYPKYFDVIHTTRVGQICHGRLRLECSSLKHHLLIKKSY